jgi:hypothetical protein
VEPELRYLPVAPLSTVAATSSSLSHLVRELDVPDLDDRVVAALVRHRLQLDRARGWVLLSGLVVTAAAVVGLGFAVHARLILGILAPLVASVPFGIGIFAERVSWELFLRTARGFALSERAAKKIYDGALGADHWMTVLATCGRPATDAEITKFVTAR